MRATNTLIPRLAFLALAGLITVVAVYALSVRPASANSFVLLPDSDLANVDGYTADDGTPCGGGGTVCSSRIDEDIDTPNDSDYIQAPFAADNADMVFTLTDGPSDLSILTDLNIRFRAYKQGGGGATGLVMTLKSNLAPIGIPLFAALTDSPTEYSYTVNNIALLPGAVDGLLGWARGDVTNPAPDTRVVITAINIEATYTPVSPNPPRPRNCGLDIALVIDSSSSIDPAELALQKAAFKGFADAFLPATPSELAVVEFNESATVLSGFSSNATTVKDAIDAASTVPLTNWDDGLYKARTLFPNRPEPDLIVFASDGFPNTLGGHEGEPILPFIGEGPGMVRAILEANAAKDAGIRIETMGIGLDLLDVPNLALISSPDAVTVTDFDQLADDLAKLATDVCKAALHVNKFYDANANGINDDSQPINGWAVRIQNSVDLLDLTPAVEALDPGDYTVSELSPVQPNWVRTTPSPVSVTLAFGDNMTVEFGNVCLGAGGGFTLGFWSNSNGKAAMNDGGTLVPELALLTALNLRNGTGANFNPTSYTQFRSWLLGANATNMAYMLSAQMAAMQLNVEAGFVSGGALIYAPALLSYSVPGMNALGFISIGDLLSAANLELGLHGVTTDGSAYRAYQEALKNALDKANNNLNFVQPRPCAFSFPAGS